MSPITRSVSIFTRARSPACWARRIYGAPANDNAKLRREIFIVDNIISMATLRAILAVGSAAAAVCSVAVLLAVPSTVFEEISGSGIDFRHANSPTRNKYLPETMGGGVALLDYDNDGRLDIFFTNGAKFDDPMPAGKMPDKSDRKFWNRLYHQNANGTFTDVTEKAGLTGMPQNRYGMGIAVGDIDNDGLEDIYVTGVGGNTLYHNNGDGTFTVVTTRAGVLGSGWSTSAGFF